MRKIGLAIVALIGVVAGTLGTSHGFGPHKNQPPCEPGYQWVQVTEYQEACREVCKIVPDMKKTTKWVYAQIDDPFCIHHSGHKHCGDGCPSCKGPYCRKKLVKKQVICEEPTTKCVVEKIVEKVPCTVYRKVPCTPSGPVATPASASSPK